MPVRPPTREDKQISLETIFTRLKETVRFAYTSAQDDTLMLAPGFWPRLSKVFYFVGFHE